MANAWQGIAVGSSLARTSQTPPETQHQTNRWQTDHNNAISPASDAKSKRARRVRASFLLNADVMTLFRRCFHQRRIGARRSSVIVLLRQNRSKRDRTR